MKPTRFSLSSLSAALAFSATLALLPVSSNACTAFQFKAGEDVFLAKNHDFMIGDGLLIVNRRGWQKAAADPAVAFQWKSVYGSVTYNQFGREFPNAGMNEAGLVVEMLWLESTRFPEADARPSLSVLQWVQYQLDTARTVEDVLASDARIRISDPAGKVHYYVVDKQGNSAVIEWHDGRRVVYSGKDLATPVTANDEYAACATALSEHLTPQDAKVAELVSYGRVLSVASYVSQAKMIGDPAQFGFAGLDRAKHPEYTRWQIVYAPTQKRLTLRRQADPTAAEIKFDALDFSPAAAPKAFRLTQSGAVNWSVCTAELNREIVVANYRTTPFLAHIPAEVVESIAAVPESFRRAD